MKDALDAYKTLSIKNGADLKYLQNVSSIDHVNGMVEVDSGEKFYAKNIVVCCGALTD